MLTVCAEFPVDVDRLIAWLGAHRSQIDLDDGALMAKRLSAVKQYSLIRWRLVNTKSEGSWDVKES